MTGQTDISKWDASPESIIRWLKSDIQQTKLDNVTTKWTDLPNDIRVKIWWYIDLFSYFVFSIALILLMFNWFKIIINAWSWKDINKEKSRIKNILIWIIWYTSVYLIIKLIVTLIGYVLG